MKSTMDIIDVIEAVAEIRKYAKEEDAEAAHAFEDKLRADFIKHVANVSRGNLGLMASAILETDKIQFNRWSA